MTSPPPTSSPASSSPAARPVASSIARPTARSFSSPASTLATRPPRERAAHEVLQPVAVALEEGGPLGLAVVREHDDLVGPGRVAPGALDAAELLVELAQRLEGVGALEAGVVGDLVVRGEGRVDGGAAGHHVGQHAVDDQVAHGHAHRRPQQRVDAAPVAARAHVAPDRADRGRPLQDDLPDDEHQGAGDVEAVGVEGAVAGVGPLLGVDPADREDRLVGLARQQVAPARPAAGEEADARWRGGARSRRSRPAPSRSSADRSPSRPSGRPGCRGSSRAGCRPGSRRSGRRCRSPTPTRRWVSSASQRAISGALPSRIARRRTGRERPSISRKTMPGTAVLGRAGGPAGDALDDPQVVGVVVVGAEDDLEHHAHGGREQRREQGPAEVRRPGSRPGAISAASSSSSASSSRTRTKLSPTV